MSESNNNLGGENIHKAPEPANEFESGGGEFDQAESGNLGAMSDDEIAALKDRAAKADENWDKYVRTVAEFDNYKKRAARERTDAVRYANESLLEKLLPVLDNFEAALNAAANAQGSMDSLKQGITMILTQIKGVLTESGLEEIDALNKPFDPNFHEAVSQQPSADLPEGQVMQQLRKGYKLRDRLVRPSMVIVSKKP